MKSLLLCFPLFLSAAFAKAQQAGRLVYQTSEWKRCRSCDTSYRESWYGDTTAGKNFMAIVYKQTLLNGIIVRSKLMAEGPAYLADASDIFYTPPAHRCESVTVFATFSELARHVGIYEPVEGRWLIRIGKWSLFSENQEAEEVCEGSPPFHIDADDWISCQDNEALDASPVTRITLRPATMSAVRVAKEK